MSEAWTESEAYEAYGEGAYDSEAVGEGAYDSEVYGEGTYEGFGEESRADRRRRERQRQIMLARQRQAQLRRQRQPPARVTRAAPPAGGPPPTIRAIRSLDLETKVGQDSLWRALQESNRRATRATWAAVASAAVDQGLDSFSADLGSHEYIKAGARFAPLLFLSPEKTRGGAEGFLTDPRVIGGAAIVGIALLGNLRSSSQGVASVSIDPPTAAIVAPAEGDPNGTGTITAEALDRHGKPVSPQPTTFSWSSSNPAVLAFPTASSGTYTLFAGQEGDVVITVRVAGFKDSLTVTVNTP